MRRKRSSKRAGSSAWMAGQFGVEALRPGVQGQGVVAAQVLDVDHFQAEALHLDHRVGQAGNPAAGKHVLADEQLGVAAADMADEMQQAQPAGLEEIGMRLDHLGQLVAPGVLEHADGDHLVVLRIHVAKVGFAHAQLLAQAAPADFGVAATAPARCVVLMPVPSAPVVSQARNMKPPKPQPMSTKRSPAREPDLAAHMVDLVALRLLQAAACPRASSRRCTSSAARRARGGRTARPGRSACRALALAWPASRLALRHSSRLFSTLSRALEPQVEARAHARRPWPRPGRPAGRPPGRNRLPAARGGRARRWPSARDRCETAS